MWRRDHVAAGALGRGFRNMIIEVRGYYHLESSVGDQTFAHRVLVPPGLPAAPRAVSNSGEVDRLRERTVIG
jgi:hypothetical protein